MELEEKKKLIPEMASKALAAHVVAYKALNLHRDFAIECLKELGVRKLNGDDFDFEAFISEELNKLPKPKDVSVSNVFSSFKDVASKIDFSKMNTGKK